MANDLTPSQLSGANFSVVRKGYDPSEVDDLLQRAAGALEHAQQQATAMEARARAAVARLQEATAQSAAAAEARPVVSVDPDQAETISRTLLLAQRTADATVAEARAEADRIRGEATAEAETTLDSTREMSARMMEEARAEARRATDDERHAAEDAVQALAARRAFLAGDVDHLEQFLEAQRGRLREVARELTELADRAPEGLGVAAAPELSEPADDPFAPVVDDADGAPDGAPVDGADGAPADAPEPQPEPAHAGHEALTLPIRSDNSPSQ